jgi:hypothetical protein
MGDRIPQGVAPIPLQATLLAGSNRERKVLQLLRTLRVQTFGAALRNELAQDRRFTVGVRHMSYSSHHDM